MIINNIKLVNFRNYEEFAMCFDKPTTLIVGDNGSGKTTVIEAIYLALQGKSFRSGDGEMVREGAEYYRVELKRRDRVVVAKYMDGKRIFEVGDKKHGRLPAAEKYPVVLFLPSDLNLVASSPTRKRDYFDGVMGVMDESYHKAITRYSKAMRQRNELLKNPQGASCDMFPWDVILAKYGVEIERGRRWLADEINKYLSEKYAMIAKKDDRCELQLVGVGDVSGEGYLRSLAECAERDRIVGHTSYGVHRDEWKFSFNGKAADKSASRGETRSMVLALKFIEAELFARRLGKKPLILLDDVFSELDDERQKNLVMNFAENQVIITSVKEIEKADL